MISRVMAALFLLATATGCTSIGMTTDARDEQDYGPPQELRVCLLKTADVPEDRANWLITAVNEEFAPFGIYVTVPWIRDWQRPGFTVDKILPELAARELEAPCDRVVGLIDRHAGDFVWGPFLPEVLGAVDDVTSTHGYVVATWGSVNQIPGGPRTAMVHEFYHLIGCPHGLTKTKCYEQIAALKASRERDADFFPGVTANGKYMSRREDVNSALRQALTEEKLTVREKRRRRNALSESGNK